jgi:predicted dehydrogenase
MGQHDLNIGVIGAGRIAEIHARSIQVIERVCVSGVADVDSNRAESYARTHHARAYASIDALLEDKSIDAVIICSPTFAHAEQAIRAAQAGKHILCEKPLAVTLEEADRIIAAADRAGVMLMVGHVLRLMPEYRIAYELLTGGELGHVRTMYAARMSGLTAGAWQGWLLDNRYSLGVFDAQIHDLDFFTWVLGKGQTITSRGWHAPAGAFEHVTSVLTFDEECWAVTESSFAVPPTYPFTMYLRAIGERGVLEFQFKGESYAKAAVRRLTLYPAQGGVRDLTPAEEDPYLIQMRHFVSGVRGAESQDHGKAADARAVLGLALSAKRSLDQGGEPISLRL